MALTQFFFESPRRSLALPCGGVSKRVAALSGVIFLSLLVGCTPEKAGQQTGKSSEQLVGAKSMVGLTSTIVCNADDYARFERPAGELIDLDRESLPRGIFLATQAEMLIEKKSEGGAPATHMIVREENVGKGGEIVCAEGLERLGADFEMVLTGLVKFETKEKIEGSGFVSRQFFFFQDKDGYGVVLSNPKQLSSRIPLDLRKILRANPAAPQLYRNSDRSYTLRYSRERDGVRGLLLVHLEVF